MTTKGAGDAVAGAGCLIFAALMIGLFGGLIFILWAWGWRILNG